MTLRDLAKTLLATKPSMIHKDLERLGHLVRDGKTWKITDEAKAKGLFVYKEYEDGYPATVSPTDQGVQQILQHYYADELTMEPLFTVSSDFYIYYHSDRLVREALIHGWHVLTRDEMIAIQKLKYEQGRGVPSNAINIIGEKLHREMNPGTILTAHRGNDDEPDRLIRVAKALGIIEHLTGHRELPLGLHDHKGDLSVNWRSLAEYKLYHKAAITAWMWLDGCDMVQHYILDQPAVGSCVLDDGYPGTRYPDTLTLLKKANQKTRTQYPSPVPLTIEERLAQLDATIKAPVSNNLLDRFRARVGQ